MKNKFLTAAALLSLVLSQVNLTSCDKETEAAIPEVNKETTDTGDPGTTGGSDLSSYRDYFYSLSKSEEGVTVVGGGTFVEDATFGTVYQNDGASKRTSYLSFDKNLMEKACTTKELTIGFWVKAPENTDFTNYFYSNLSGFYTAAPSSIDETPSPCFFVESRGWVGINDNTGNWQDWTLGDAAYSIDWLKDNKWHYYTVTVNSTTVKAYIDATELALAESTGTTDKTLEAFFSGTLFNYFTLGGCQALGWADNDTPYQYANLSVYSKVLTPEQINTAMNYSQTITPVYTNDLSSLTDDISIVGAGSFVSDATYGTVYQNIQGNPRTNYLLLPSDVLQSAASKKELSVSFMVKAPSGSSNFYYSAMFSAHTSQAAAGTDWNDSYAFFAMETRLIVLQNSYGNSWTNSDYIDMTYDYLQCTESNYNHGGPMTDWLTDNAWHNFTFTVSESATNIYIDGRLYRTFSYDATICDQAGADGKPNHTVKGLFDNITDFTYVTLGGNQTMNYNDGDTPFQFAKLKIYNKVLSADKVSELASSKYKYKKEE